MENIINMKATVVTEMAISPIPEEQIQPLSKSKDDDLFG